MRNKNKNSKAILNIVMKDPMFKKEDKKEMLGYIEGARQFVKYMKSHPMESVNEDIGIDTYLGGIIKAMRNAGIKPKTAKQMKSGFSKSKDKIGFFIDVEKREIEGKKLWTLQLEVDRDGYLWYLSAPKDIKIGKWADKSQLARGFKKLNMLPGFGQDAIFKRRK